MDSCKRFFSHLPQKHWSRSAEAHLPVLAVFTHSPPAPDADPATSAWPDGTHSIDRSPESQPRIAQSSRFAIFHWASTVQANQPGELHHINTVRWGISSIPPAIARPCQASDQRPRLPVRGVQLTENDSSSLSARSAIVVVVNRQPGLQRANPDFTGPCTAGRQPFVSHVAATAGRGQGTGFRIGAVQADTAGPAHRHGKFHQAIRRRGPVDSAMTTRSGFQCLWR